MVKNHFLLQKCSPGGAKNIRVDGASIYYLLYCNFILEIGNLQAGTINLEVLAVT